jgi:transposase
MGIPNTSRIEQIAPLVATGLSVRQIAAETGIPTSSVFRAKRQLEKAQAAEQSSTGAAAAPATKAQVDQEPDREPAVQDAPSSVHEVCALCGVPGHVGYGPGDLLPAQIRRQTFVVHAHCFPALVTRLW